MTEAERELILAIADALTMRDRPQEEYLGFVRMWQLAVKEEQERKS